MIVSQILSTVGRHGGVHSSLVPNGGVQSPSEPTPQQAATLPKREGGREVNSVFNLLVERPCQEVEITRLPSRSPSRFGRVAACCGVGSEGLCGSFQPAAPMLHSIQRHQLPIPRKSLPTECQKCRPRMPQSGVSVFPYQTQKVIPGSKHRVVSS